MRILITGGSGFIGSNFIRFLLKDSGEENLEICNFDKLTYAGQGKNIGHMGLSHDPRYTFIRGDVSIREQVEHALDLFDPSVIVNFAAESHVDRSISNSMDFVTSNVSGTVNLLDVSIGKLEKFVQISTDEVYGSRKEGSFNEDDLLNPSSPYSASKAAAEQFAVAYHKTHSAPVIITRSSNNYGPFQLPEKLIPLFITNLIDGKKVPLMWSEDNPGLNVRDWIHVEDNCRAIWHILNHGKVGEVYNIPGNSELNNLEITRAILYYFGKGDEMIEHMPHRKGHDFRYSISGDKLADLGFKVDPGSFYRRLDETCKWYEENQSWWRPLKGK